MTSAVAPMTRSALVAQAGRQELPCQGADQQQGSLPDRARKTTTPGATKCRAKNLPRSAHPEHSTANQTEVSYTVIASHREHDQAISQSSCNGMGASEHNPFCSHPGGWKENFSLDDRYHILQKIAMVFSLFFCK